MNNLIVFIFIGFFAQMINGSLGMSFGTLSLTFLLAMGVPPVIASTSVHISKAVTGYASGISHWKLKNVDKNLALKLTLSGVVGGIIGALVLTILPESFLKPVIAIYLLLTGVHILWRAIRQSILKRKRLPVLPLGAFGGFIDAVGGGGWGPVVTSTLLSNGYNPHSAIGSVSLAEAFVATAVTVVLLFRITLADMNWAVVIGLMVGGMIAAPFAAMLCGRLNVQRLMVGVGGLVILLSLNMLWVTLR